MIRTGRGKFRALLFLFAAFCMVSVSAIFSLHFGCSVFTALAGMGFGGLFALFLLGEPIALTIQPFEERIVAYLETEDNKKCRVKKQ